MISRSPLAATMPILAPAGDVQRSSPLCMSYARYSHACPGSVVAHTTSTPEARCTLAAKPSSASTSRDHTTSPLAAVRARIWTTSPLPGGTPSRGSTEAVTTRSLDDVSGHSPATDHSTGTVRSRYGSTNGAPTTATPITAAPTVTHLRV